jgi:hypothetical protein
MIGIQATRVVEGLAPKFIFDSGAALPTPRPSGIEIEPTLFHHDTRHN